jgi:putative flavoprotein involved in K+ transport
MYGGTDVENSFDTFGDPGPQDGSDLVDPVAPTEDLRDEYTAWKAANRKAAREADAYAARNRLDLPPDPDAHLIGPDPDCVRNPILSLSLADAGITAILWATGYALDYGWLKVDAFDENGRPAHQRGVTGVPGLYFLGLPWLSRRASPFIWGVWHDADYLAQHIAARR